MANYRAGDVIRLTRNAIGMTQEQLSEGICSVETLSRIENNRQGIGIEVYGLLMAKMERNPLRSYAICSSTDMRIAEEKKALEDAVAKVDYEKAKVHLMKMKSMMSATNYNQQYLGRFEALIAYHTKEIEENELIEQLDKAIRLTLPEYEKYLESEDVFPFTEQELMTLMSLANAYMLAERNMESLYIYESLLKCLEGKYIDNDTIRRMKLVVMANGNKVLGILGKHDVAIERAQDIIEQACRYNYGHVLSNALVSLVWNTKQENRNELIDNKLMKQKLRQAYYIAVARKDVFYINMIKKYYIELFEESIN